MIQPLAALGPGRADPALLVALRAIDTDADLVHLGGHAWLLGVRQPNPAAREKLDRLLAKALRAKPSALPDRAERAYIEGELAKQIRVLQLCADGFKPIQLYECEKPGYEIVEDFRIRDHNWRVRPEAAFQEFRDAISADVQDRKRTDLVREFFEQEGGSIFRHVFRRARSFLQGRRGAATTPQPQPRSVL